MEALAGKFLMFIESNPGLGLLLLAGMLIFGRKVWRHWSKQHAYTFKDLKKYPQEIVELVFIGLVALTGIITFIQSGGQ